MNIKELKENDVGKDSKVSFKKEDTEKKNLKEFQFLILRLVN